MQLHWRSGTGRIPLHPTTFGGQLWVFARTVVCCLSRRRAKVGGTVRGTNPPCAVMLKTRPHLPSGEQTEFSMLSDGWATVSAVALRLVIAAQQSVVVGQWAETTTNESWSAAYCSWSSGDSVLTTLSEPQLSQSAEQTLYTGQMVRW